MSAEQNRDLAFRGLDAINRQDVAGLDAVFSPAWAAEIRGWLPAGGAAWHGHRLEMIDLIADDERVWCRLRATGAHNSAGAGIAATDEGGSISGVWFLRIAHDKITAFEWLFDELGLLRQLGMSITPPPAGHPLPGGARLARSQLTAW